MFFVAIKITKKWLKISWRFNEIWNVALKYIFADKSYLWAHPLDVSRLPSVQKDSHGPVAWKQCCAGWEGISAFGAVREDDSFIKIYQPSDIVAQFHWLVLEKETTQKTMIRFWRRRVWGQSQVCKSLICKQWNWVKEFACNLCYANTGLHHPKVFGQKRLCIFRVSLGSSLSFVVLLPSAGHIFFLFLVEVPILTKILSQLKCHA